jgi:hypothetical protein
LAVFPVAVRTTLDPTVVVIPLLVPERSKPLAAIVPVPAEVLKTQFTRPLFELEVEMGAKVVPVVKVCPAVSITKFTVVPDPDGNTELKTEAIWRSLPICSIVVPEATVVFFQVTAATEWFTLVLVMVLVPVDANKSVLSAWSVVRDCMPPASPRLIEVFAYNVAPVIEFEVPLSCSIEPCVDALPPDMMVPPVAIKFPYTSKRPAFIELVCPKYRVPDVMVTEVTGGCTAPVYAVGARTDTSPPLIVRLPLNFSDGVLVTVPLPKINCPPALTVTLAARLIRVVLVGANIRIEAPPPEAPNVIALETVRLLLRARIFDAALVWVMINAPRVPDALAS